MRKNNELTAKDLKDICNPSQFKFETTKELGSSSNLIYGQERAIKALKFGLDIDIKGYNLYLEGTTGVGKTEVARSLAYELFDDEHHMVRIDMSEYMEKFSVSRLIGSPPGYVGYDDGGQLTEAVRRNPYSVILFDEIEKAHPEVLNLLLQILDEGRLTDSNGRLVDFKNTIIIMTSNLGSENILEGKKEQVLTEIRNYFRPEFINRIDEVIIFNCLDQDAITKILDKIIEEIEKRIKHTGIKIELTNKLSKYLIETGYNNAYGARPLKRLVTTSIETLLAKELIKSDIKQNSKIIFDYKNEQIVLENRS